MTDTLPQHMTPAEFRAAAARTADWVAGYWKRLELLPAFSQVKPGDIRAQLPTSAPEHGEPFDAVLGDLDRIILPGITHWQSPGLYAFFPGNASGPAALGDLISAGLGVQGMLWASSPACTELETHVLDSMIDLLGLPDRFRSTGAGGGVIQDIASSASLCALLAARERATDGAVICARHGLWLHVDAAHAGSAAICPEFRRFHDGLEHADSYCFNPHKWLLTNFDCDCFYVADRSTLLAALSVLPEYLRNRASESGAVFDYRDWHIPLGRRFRALKLWFVVRHYGAEGLRKHIRHTVSLAQALARLVRADERLVLAAPVPLNLVCFRHRLGDEATQRVLDCVNASGEAYLTHTRLHDRLVIRVAVGSPRTELRHIERLWELILAAG